MLSRTFFGLACCLAIAYASNASSSDKVTVASYQESIIAWSDMDLAVTSGFLLLREKKVPLEIRAKALITGPFSDLINLAMKIMFNENEKGFEAYHEELILELIREKVDPYDYIEMCRHEPHFERLNSEFMTRVLNDEKYHTGNMLKRIFYNLVKEVADAEEMPLIGKYRLPYDGVTVKYIALMQRLLVKDKVRADFISHIDATLGNPAIYEVLDDYLSGRAYKCTFEIQNPLIYRLSAGLLLVLPRLFSDEMFASILFEIQSRKMYLFMAKVNLLKYYDPLDRKLNDNVSEESEAHIAMIVTILERLSNFTDLQAALQFCNPKLFAKVTTDSEEEASKILSIDDGSVPFKIILKNDAESAKYLLSGDNASMKYGKELLCSLKMIRTNEAFCSEVFKLYGSYNEPIDMPAFLKFLILCPKPEDFLKVCRHHSEDIPLVFAAVRNMESKKMGPLKILELLFTSLYMPSDEKTPLFGNLRAPEIRYLRDLSCLDAFETVEGAQYVCNVIKKLAGTKNTSLLSLRKAYMTASLSQKDMTTETKFTPNEYNGNLLMLKILPFILPGKALLRLYRMNLPRAEMDTVMLLDCLSLHDPLTFTCSKTWQPPKVRPFHDSFIVHLENVPLRRQVLRSIIRSQPKVLKSILSHDSFKKTSFASMPGFLVQLAQDYLSRAYACPELFKSEEAMEMTDFAYKVIGENLMFDLDKAETPLIRLVLIQLELDFDTEMQNLFKYEDSDFLTALSVFIRCAKDPSKLKSSIITCMDGKYPRKQKLLDTI